MLDQTHQPLLQNGHSQPKIPCLRSKERAQCVLSKPKSSAMPDREKRKGYHVTYLFLPPPKRYLGN
jgi:hypothetical protein